MLQSSVSMLYYSRSYIASEQFKHLVWRQTDRERERGRETFIYFLGAIKASRSEREREKKREGEREEGVFESKNNKYKMNIPLE